ncbi:MULTISPECIES: DUF3604 domain-containing protein [unclassified Novosphingobium]|uniref:DUF3604 domain-containing protein n=1 Tax=unclassified Novosphingobium TaxID=2644732 RepID=UPI0025FAE73C|nr:MULTISPECIES: DUF3604 domain-containing protein [unclassified Novosphingobium]HQV02821.1 DUF3604 domain-containing protein [Novosphingobium sp.]
MRKAIVSAALLLASTALVTGCDKLGQAGGGKAEVKNTAYPEQVFWGDTHLHTSNSVDAFGFGNRLDPEAALRFARGEEVESTTGVKAKLARPLDFLVISDHAENIGATKALYEAPRIMIKDPTALRWYDMMHEGPEGSMKAVGEMLAARAGGTFPPALNDPVRGKERMRKLWDSHLDTVEDYNEPGKFTAFMGFEYTLMQTGNNLHRNVIFRDGKDRVGKIMPWDPEGTLWPDDLWTKMETYEKETGGKVLAIPHNGNLSNGLMWMMTEPNGGPITAEYARRRALHEPIAEITQIKGDSEAHPFMSPNDEFAGYGTSGWDQANLLGNIKTKQSDLPGSYAREALKRGLLIEQRTGVNPYKFGVIGSTDSHTSLSTPEENNFFGKHAGVEPSPKRATAGFVPGVNSGRMNWQSLASGYAAVWATSNTREAIFDAMMRREVYATTGPRMTVRMFGGWDFKADDLKGDWVKAGYARGVPMGGELKAGSGKPAFLISALKDPQDGNLDRVQVIKGWVDVAGQAHEKVFDVVWSDMDKRVAAGGKVPAVGDTVDVTTATYQNTIGAPSLATVWTDPEFDPKQRAFYYVRVLQIPTPTWMTYDMVKYKLTLPPEIPLKHQERAYTSAIWYNPA